MEKVTLTGQELMELWEGVQALADHLIQKGLALKAYDLGLTKNRIQSKATALIGARSALIKKHGKDDGKGNFSVEYGTKDYERYQEDVEEILAVSEEFDLRKIELTQEELVGLRGVAFLAVIPILEIK